MTTKHHQEASPAHNITPEILRVPEAARRLNVSQRTVRRLVKTGELLRLAQCRHILIPISELERLLDVRGDLKASRKGGLK